MLQPPALHRRCALTMGALDKGLLVDEDDGLEAVG
jgi:hypothetical protein